MPGPGVLHSRHGGGRGPRHALRQRPGAGIHMLRHGRPAHDADAIAEPSSASRARPTVCERPLPPLTPLFAFCVARHAPPVGRACQLCLVSPVTVSACQWTMCRPSAQPGPVFSSFSPCQIGGLPAGPGPFGLGTLLSPQAGPALQVSTASRGFSLSESLTGSRHGLRVACNGPAATQGAAAVTPARPGGATSLRPGSQRAPAAGSGPRQAVPRLGAARPAQSPV